MTMFKVVMLTTGAIGLAATSWTLSVVHLLLPSLLHTAGLLGSVLALLVLVIIGYIGCNMVIKSTVGKGGAWLLLCIASIIGVGLVVVAIPDLWPNGGLRALPGVASLPHGNLWLNGGLIGWTYVAFFVALFLGIPYGAILNKVKSKPSLPSLRDKKRQKTQVPERDGLTGRTSVEELFGEHNFR